MKSALVLFIVLAGVSPAGVGQILTPKDQFILNVDYARFHNNQQSSYLELYYDFYPKYISYAKIGGKLQGAVRMTMKLTNKATNEVLVRQNSFVPVTMDDTVAAGMGSTIVSQLGYAVPFGEYLLHVVAFDSLTPSRRDSLLLTITFRAPSAAVSSSDLELCSSVRQSSNKEDLFYKNSFEVVPNPTLVFGSSSYPVVFHYLELYNLDATQSYTLTAQVVSPSGKVVKESSQKKSYKVGNAVEVGTTNVVLIPSGKYVFRMLLADEKGQELVRVEKNFFLHNPQLKVTGPSPVAIGASELLGLSGPELAEEFRRCQYVATPSEIKMFANITSDEGRREFLARMWLDLEAGRDGRPPITRTEYYRRVSIANQRYHAFSKEGWRTDRGRVFILYSDPDDIERVPASERSKPYEIWHYNSIENGVIFVFLERSGFGDYILVHSTKRGEVQDENWETDAQTH